MRSTCGDGTSMNAAEMEMISHELPGAKDQSHDGSRNNSQLPDQTIDNHALRREKARRCHSPGTIVWACKFAIET